MRLFLSVLLVILALYCYEANAFTCPALVEDTLSFLFQNAAIYKKTREKYNLPQDAIQAKLEVKDCTDKIFLGNRILIANTLGEILKKCFI
ncbi:secretoglobin family 1D member 2 [Callorhinus ursinus]|uniref:Secretoglobin family 1D member 2-like n=1 Tax=Callorhinus ursinus TaxID=34884 RepID=A0A3Q7PVU5_CALUR|nr:secretoglobin family 1D member 2-like [Callorhinus ursinus]